MTTHTMSTREIDQFLATAVADGEVPGLSALAVTDRGVRYAGSFGDRADGAPWTEHTVAWLGSMTKMIVAIGALQLVEQGRLGLDDDLGTLLPALAEAKVLEGFDDEGRPRVRPASGAITLRRLLSHTAGNGYHFWNADVLRYQEVEQLPGIIECREATLTTPLLFDPGTAWEYGMNLDWVGKAIEAVSGQDLEQYLRACVLDPLGMSATSFRLGPVLRDELAAMYARTPDGLVQIEFEMTQEPEFLMAGGAMYGSPADYLTLLRMILGGGEVDGVRILREDTVAEALSNQIGDLSIGKITTVDPGSSNDVEFMPGTTKKWSLLGMLNVEETPGGRSAGSLFWAGLPNAYYWVDRDQGNAGVLFTQILPFGDVAVIDLFDRFENAVRAL
jgi:methyl acetate hydrolase